jgi:simple sugar transport system permease protein
MLYLAGEILLKTIPILFTGLAYSLSVKAGLFNIGCEGQLYAGAFFSTLAAITPLNIPPFFHITLCLAAGFLGGAFWGCIAALLKTIFNAHEVITTIMLNYIAIQSVSLAVSGPMIFEAGGYPQSVPIENSAYLARILGGTRLHAGIFIALFFALVYHFFLNHTTTGFELRAVGLNKVAAKYSGMNNKKVVLIALSVSGALAGLCGANEILGVQHRLIAGLSGGYGFDGIAVALLGQNTALGIVLAALFFGALKAFANQAQILYHVPVQAVFIVEAVIIFVLSALNEKNRGANV